MRLQIQTIPDQHIAYVRAYGSYPVVIPQSFKTLCEAAGPLGLFGPGVKCLCVCHHDPRITPESELCSDAAMTVDPSFVPTPPLAARTIPGGKYAVVSYIGPYSGLPVAWADALHKLIPEARLTPRAGEWFEVYENDPCTTPPAELHTDIYIAVE